MVVRFLIPSVSRCRVTIRLCATTGKGIFDAYNQGDLNAPLRPREAEGASVSGTRAACELAIRSNAPAAQSLEPGAVRSPHMRLRGLTRTSSLQLGSRSAMAVVLFISLSASY